MSPRHDDPGMPRWYKDKKGITPSRPLDDDQFMDAPMQLTVTRTERRVREDIIEWNVVRSRRDLVNCGCLSESAVADTDEVRYALQLHYDEGCAGVDAFDYDDGHVVSEGDNEYDWADDGGYSFNGINEWRQ